MSLAKEKCKRSGDGADPITGYLIASETEKKLFTLLQAESAPRQIMKP